MTVADLIRSKIVVVMMQMGVLEERQSSSSDVIIMKVKRDRDEDDEDEKYKSLSTALEEVSHKGTLIERLTILENRVLEVLYLLI